MNSTANITLVCFDLGGVVVRICRSWREGCQRAGLPVRDGADHPDMRQRRRQLSHEYQSGRLDCGEFFNRMADATGTLYTPEEIRRIHDAWLIDQYPGIDTLLARLADRIDTGILSNTNATHWAAMLPDRTDAPPRFPAVAIPRHKHASHLLGAAKPDPAIYRAFEAAAGHAGPNILFFDDLEENIAAARAAGWNARHIDPLADPPAQIAAELARHGIL
jgi:glucose-1-phosphatase